MNRGGVIEEEVLWLHERVQSLELLLDKILRELGVWRSLGKDVTSLIELLLNIFPHWLGVLKEKVLSLNALHWHSVKFHDLIRLLVLLLESGHLVGYHFADFTDHIL